MSRAARKPVRRAPALHPGPEEESDRLLWEVDEFDEDALDLVTDVRRVHGEEIEISRVC